jgi:hypothetical protein
MKTITITIKGTTPLLMNKYNIESQLAQGKGRRITKTYDPEEEAELSAYWSTTSKKKELIIPANVIYAAILKASSFHKINRRSAKSILAGSIRIEPEEISLGTDQYKIDLRPVVIQRNRVPKARARLDEWSATFKIVYNEKLIGDPMIIKTVLEEAGQRIGIMDFRPTNSGWYGCFSITEWKEK